jgi:oxalate---CoA ligase
MVAAQSDLYPDQKSIFGLERQALTYAQLHHFIQVTISSLNSFGIGRNERVAIVLPNGPEMATAFLSVAAGATAAPLNPAYRAPELEYFLTDLAARALITLPGLDTLAVEVASKLGIPTLYLIPDEDQAGIFRLEGEWQSLKAASGPAELDDIALVLHTSGTTSRPKIVPLTHANLAVSARNIYQTLKLTPTDRCLNIMPLFHIHGLMAATLATISVGAGLVCTPGFFAPQFFEWIRNFKPTWYTAVPTMHQAILTRAAANQDVLSETQLRFVRSSSASLPPQIMAALEQTFNCPVIEAYGMTEASHQMTSNPLPPQERKPGSVGLTAGPKVAIMATEGTELLPSSEIGEIVIQGENVTRGYANNPEANATAFTLGWFRTGDQGYIDDDGYVFLTGRLKEIINRGGEKISPREVDEVLLAHPQVKQALAFALSDPKLGEDIAAAVVLTEPGTSEKELRKFVASQLSHFKVPRRIVILADIPKGPTGKLQRIGLAEKLGLDQIPNAPEIQPDEIVFPSTVLEMVLAEIWQNVLGLSSVGINQNFLDVGGDSILATKLISRIRTKLNIQISMIDFFDAPTIAAQAEIITVILSQDDS